MNKMRVPLWLVVVIAVAYVVFLQPWLAPNNQPQTVEVSNKLSVEEGGEYSDKDHVALYIHTYGKLPKNYITKKEAEREGWVSHEGNLAKVLPGKSIGGDRFSNFEGSLPAAKGRSYTECDIDYTNGGRNAKRIVFSNDGLIFYSDSHYNNFEQLY